MFEVSNKVPREIQDALENGLAAHTAVQNMPTLIFSPLSIIQRDDKNVIVAGLFGQSFWDWLYIDSIWVADDLRDQGKGRALMEAAEIEAKKRGCIGVHLWTQSFDAPDFYPKLGYTEFARMDDFPIGHQRIGFMKRLAA